MLLGYECFTENCFGRRCIEKSIIILILLKVQTRIAFLWLWTKTDITDLIVFFYYVMFKYQKLEYIFIGNVYISHPYKYYLKKKKFNHISKEMIFLMKKLD